MSLNLAKTPLFCVFSGLPVPLKKKWKALIEVAMNNSWVFPLRKGWADQVETPGRRKRWFLPWGDTESAPRRSFQNRGEAGKEMNWDSAAQQTPCRRKCEQTGGAGPLTRFKISFVLFWILKVRRELRIAAVRLQTFRFWNEVFVDCWRSKLCQNYVIIV